jgi:flagellar biogenesis protein FliO
VPVAAPEAARVPWRASLLIGVSAALGGAAVWVRSRKGGLAKLTSSRELRVVSTVRVGPKGHLVLAGIGDRVLLLGVTDSSVRRIAWLPADSIASGATEATLVADATRPADPTSTARIPATFAGASSAESARTPSRRATAAKSGFAEMLRKIGGRHVDAPPSIADDISAASTLAELHHDSVLWSKNATSAAAPSAPMADRVNEPGAGEGELEQQAAGILKRRSRRRV